MFPGVNYQQIQDTLTEAQCDLGGAVNRLLATAGAGILCLFHCKYECYIWKSMSIGKCILGGKSHANLTNQHIYMYFYDDELHLKLCQKLGTHNLSQKSLKWSSLKLVRVVTARDLLLTLVVLHPTESD